MTLLTTLTRTAGAVLFAALMLTQGQTVAHVHDTVAGDLTIGQAHARPNLPNRPTAAYMTISNAGDTPERLLAATSDAFGTIELHTVETQDGVMKMMPIEAVEVPADGTAVLEPGGMHMMLFDAKQRFKPGDSFKATLTFETAGDVTVMFMVQKPKHGAKKSDHSGHGTGHSGHSGHGSGS